MHRAAARRGRHPVAATRVGAGALVAITVSAAVLVPSESTALVGLQSAERLRSTTTALHVMGAVDADAVVAQQVLDEVNAHRRSAGLRPVVLDRVLELVAAGHATDQAAQRTMTHTGTDGSTAGTRIARVMPEPSWWGENVAYGYGTARAVVDAWMRSPGHRAIVLSPNAESMGVAVRRSVEGVSYWAQLFAGTWRS